MIFQLIISLIKVFSKKKSLSKYENWSKWGLFWPAMEVFAFTQSLLIIMLIGYILHTDAKWNSEDTVVPPMVNPESN